MVLCFKVARGSRGLLWSEGVEGAVEVEDEDEVEVAVDGGRRVGRREVCMHSVHERDGTVANDGRWGSEIEAIDAMAAGAGGAGRAFHAGTLEVGVAGVAHIRGKTEREGGRTRVSCCLRWYL